MQSTKIQITKCPFDVKNPDLLTVGAARISLNTHKTELDEKDYRLISRLIQHKHVNTLFHAWGCSQVRVAPTFRDQYESAGFEYNAKDRTLTYSLLAMPMLFDGHAAEELQRVIPLKSHQEFILNSWPEKIKLNKRHPLYRHTYYITAPFFVANQWKTHRIGFSRSEVSRRYVSGDCEYFFPEQYNKAAKRRMQGNDGPHDDQGYVSEIVQTSAKGCDALYTRLLDKGLCPEQARMILPMNTMTTWMETASNLAICRALDLRLDEHAQEEVRELVAKQLLNFLGFDPRKFCNWEEKIR